MARKDRTDNRKTREQRRPLKIPELGYYLVVTDTEATERCYFQGLHKELPKDIQNKLVIKVVETKTRAMIDKCLEMTAYDAQYRMPWIVFDRDEVKDFDEIIKEAEALDINVGWSNPCFEIWMYSYYGAMPAIMESWVCCDEFEKIFQRKTGQKYSKSDAGLYEKIFRTGDEEKALQIARQKYEQCVRDGKTIPSKMYPCTTVYQLFLQRKGFQGELFAMDTRSPAFSCPFAGKVIKHGVYPYITDELQVLEFIDQPGDWFLWVPTVT